MQIDPYLFKRQLEAFRAFVEEHERVPFVSFSSHPYTEKEEGYKYEVYKAARKALAFQDWKVTDIGSGKIAEATIAAIDVRDNNLVSWQTKHKTKAYLRQLLDEPKSQPDQLLRIEGCLFRLYREQHDEKSFSDLFSISIFKKSYRLLAYFFFLKDRLRYLPIVPTYFDRSFEYLGVDFKTTRSCSWKNYSDFVGLIGQLKEMLTESLSTENLSVEVTLLDAHSFAWMLAAQMESENKLANVQAYLDLPASEREAISKARVGQDRFRQSLINYWSRCAVTGCRETDLLRASHIKSWKESSPFEKTDPYNGLLLSPSLDVAFDTKYISFDNEGSILISKRLAAADAEALGIHPKMRLRHIEPEHRKYLSLHREQLLK